MCNHGSDEFLADKRHATVMLRLLADPQGMLIQGEVVDLLGRTRGRFRTWQGLTRALKAALADDVAHRDRSLSSLDDAE